MLRVSATKNYLGVKVMGDYQDLRNLYYAISNIVDLLGNDHVETLLLGLNYELRKASQKRQGNYPFVLRN